MINLLVVFVAVWVVFIDIINKMKPAWKYVAYGVAILFFSFNAVKCRTLSYHRYSGWMNVDFNKNLKALLEIEPSFQEWGVGKDDKVISVNDFSINGSLYYMNRKGYTQFGSDLLKAETFYQRIEQGAKYLVVTDTTILEQEHLKLFTVKPVGNFENVFLYDIQGIKQK